MRDFVCRPPPANTRLYCTMIRRDVEESAASVGNSSNSDLEASYTPGYGVAFTLYLEFLGGLIPLLKVNHQLLESVQRIGDTTLTTVFHWCKPL